MARVPFRLPDIGEGIAEAEIAAWHVAVGDRIEEDAPLADMLTDKATVELTSPVAGTVVERAGEVGDKVAIGSVLVTFETDGPAPSAEAAEPGIDAELEPEAHAAAAPAAAPATAALPPPAEAAHRVLASPAVRARARALGIDLAEVKTADGGRIRHGDLDAYLLYRGGGAMHPPHPDDRIEEIKVIGLRRRIAEHMAEARAIVPFTYVEEVDVTALEASRAALNDEAAGRPRLTLLPFIARAIVLAVAEVPQVNALYDDEAGIVRRHSAVHLGIATQTDDGLIVPVLRDAGSHDLWGAAAEIARLAAAVRDGTAKREELAGSTITVTSLGALGGIVSTPVVNRPELAIIGVNRVVERPAMVDGQIEPRRLMNLSSSFDHRIVDGMDAARFIQAVKRRLETPVLLSAVG
jgi:2-oxoisovalerate dehydrogenase E2 component (dihydrolipoyl transacylase)